MLPSENYFTSFKILSSVYVLFAMKCNFKREMINKQITCRIISLPDHSHYLNWSSAG